MFYLGADRAVLDPLAAPVDDTYSVVAARRRTGSRSAATTRRRPARRTHDAQHRAPRGRGAGGSPPTCGPRASAAGALLVAALGVLLGSGLGRARRRRGARCSPLVGLGADRRPAGVGPQAAGALPLPVHPRPTTTSWLVWAARACCRSAPCSRRLVRSPASRRLGDDAGRRRGAGAAGRPRRCDGRRLHRVPVRPGRGPRPLAVAAGCSGTCWPRRPWSVRGRAGRRRWPFADVRRRRCDARRPHAAWPPRLHLGRRSPSSYGGPARQPTTRPSRPAPIIRGRYARLFWTAARSALGVARGRRGASSAGTAGCWRRGRRRPARPGRRCSRTRASTSAPARTSRCRDEELGTTGRAAPPRGAAHRTRTCATSRRPRSGTRHVAYDAKAHPRKVAARVHADPDDVLQLRVGVRPAGATSPRTTCRSPRSRATRRTPARAAATAPRARPPSTRSTTRSGSCTRCAGSATAVRASGSG